MANDMFFWKKRGMIMGKKIVVAGHLCVDFFVPSAEELCYMLDRERYEEWMRRADGGDVTEILRVEEDIRPLAREAMELGAKILLIKCGVTGMYYCTGTEDVIDHIPKSAGLKVTEWSNQEGFQKSYVPERVRSGTGAGDSSIAAFLFACLKGYRFGSVSASRQQRELPVWRSLTP